MAAILRVGLVGGGGISETHARAVLGVPGVCLTAVQGTNADKVASLCSRYGGTPFTRLDAFLAHQPMDMVIIGSPSGLHAAQGIEAVRRGLHVLVEKPIDISSTRADRLIAAADEGKVRLGVIFQDRFKPGVVEMKRLLEAGALGRPLLVQARVPWYRPPEYYAASRWRGTLALDGGGALINQAIHTLDLLLWLLGPVDRVQARTATLLHDVEVEDSGIAILEFGCGALGGFTFTTAAFPGAARRITISGDKGTAVLEDDEIVELHRPGVETRQTTTRGHDSERSSSPSVSDASAHRAVLEDFIEAVRDNRAPRCDGRDGRRTLAVVEAIYRASRDARPTAVER